MNIVVTHGEAAYWGLVDSEAQKRALRVAAENVRGVNRVVDNVSVISLTVRASIGTQ